MSELEGPWEKKMNEKSDIGSNDDDAFQCQSCGCISRTDVISLFILVGGNTGKAGQMGAMPLGVIVCPECFTIQIPREAHKEMIKSMKSNIIVPR